MCPFFALLWANITLKSVEPLMRVSLPPQLLLSGLPVLVKIVLSGPKEVQCHWLNQTLGLIILTISSPCVPILDLRVLKSIVQKH